MEKSNLFKTSKMSLSMLRPAPQHEMEAVQQDRDSVIRSWEKLYNSILCEYPALSKIEKQLKGNKELIGWHLLAYAFRFNVVWEGELSFMEDVIDRYMHIDQRTYIEYAKRPIYLPWCTKKEFDPKKFKGKVI